MTITKAYQSGDMFEVHYDDGIIRNVPEAKGNRHYTELQEWLAKEENSLSVKPKPAITGDQVNQERQRRIEEGTTVDVIGYGSIPVQGRMQDMINIQGLAFLAESYKAEGVTAAVITFRDANNTNHMLTPNQVSDLFEKSTLFIDKMYKKSWELKNKATIPQSYATDKYWTDAE